MNQGPRFGKYKGVSFDKRYQTYRVSIRHENNGYYLGSFKDEIEAAEAYDRAAIFYFGEFAYLNFPENKEEYKQNPYNPNQAKSRSSGYKGVCWHKGKGKYAAYVRINGKNIHVGMFESAYEAALERDAMAIELLGNKVKLNFPQRIEPPKNDNRSMAMNYLLGIAPSTRLKFLNEISKLFCLKCGNDYNKCGCERL